MENDKKYLVIMTHQLPSEWISALSEECKIIAGPPDATQLGSELQKHLDTADGLVSLLTIPITQEILKGAPKLRVVSNMAVGIDNIDIKACTKRKIPVGNTPGVLTESTADLTMALMLSVARNLPSSSKDAREGKWKTWLPNGWLGLELSGSTLGIIGMGKIGQAVAKRAQGFGMNVIYSDPQQINVHNTRQVNFDELLIQSDIISLHAPLTEETKGLINSTSFTKMKQGVIIINAARGPLIHTDALIDALANHRIAAVGLDVTDPEPLPPNHPLYKFPNCFIVPHIGSATHVTRRRMAELACQNLIAGLHGERLPNCVNPEVYD